MSFRDSLVADAAQFLEDFGELVTRQIDGDHNDTESVRAIVDWDREVDNSSMNPSAAAASTTDAAGQRVTAYCTLELLASQEVLETDRFVVRHGKTGNNVVVNAVRQTGSDEGLQSWLCQLPGGRSSKMARIRR